MRPAATKRSHARRPPRSEEVILFAVGDQLFAIAAAAVKEVRSTDSLSAAALSFTHPALEKVSHTMQRGRQLYFVMSLGLHFHLPPSRPSLALVLRQSRLALLVDRIERMEKIFAVYALPHAFRGEERRWYRGLAYLGEIIVPLVDPGGFLTEDEWGLLVAAVASTAGALPGLAERAVVA
jgi:chemotaxis signal transduction protein